MTYKRVGIAFVVAPSQAKAHSPQQGSTILLKIKQSYPRGLIDTMDMQVKPPTFEKENNPQLTPAPDDDDCKRNQPTPQEYIPETINISHVEDADKEDDTLSTISGLTLPQEAFDVLFAPVRKQEEKEEGCIINIY